MINHSQAKEIRNSAWFEELFGFPENPTNIDKYLLLENLDNHIKFHCDFNHSEFIAGKFSTRQLSSFQLQSIQGPNLGTFSIINNYKDYMIAYANPEFCGSTFQIDTQFNCLDYVSIDQDPQQPISCYIYNNVNSSQASVSTSPSLIYRNYFLTLSQQEINLLDRTPIPVFHGFSMMQELNSDDKFKQFNYKDLDVYKIGVQENCQVCITRNSSHNLAIVPYHQIIHQVFVSSLNFPKNKDKIPSEIGMKLTQEIEPYLLEAEYKATILAAWENSIKYPENPGAKKCFLTIIGYELWNVPLHIVFQSILACKDLIQQSGLEVILLVTEDKVYHEACYYLSELVNHLSDQFIVTK